MPKPAKAPKPTPLEGAGRTLHDDVGPLLSAVGLHLQLVATDYPETAERLDKVFHILDDAMERVRSLSRQLSAPQGSAGSPKPRKRSS